MEVATIEVDNGDVESSSQACLGRLQEYMFQLSYAEVSQDVRLDDGGFGNTTRYDIVSVNKKS
jgi:hypothetical protein